MVKKAKTVTYYEAIGRRKSAVALVRLYISPKASKTTSSMNKGDFLINSIPAKEYFQFEPYVQLFQLPLHVVDALERFAISVIATGGGKRGQLDAVRLGLARALEQADENNRKKLKAEGLLTRDSRVRERRKAGTGGRARRKKQSPKR